MKRFALLIIAVALAIALPASAKEVTFSSGPHVSSAKITDYDARKLSLEINRNNGTVVFYEPEDDKDAKNHRVLFWAEKFPQGTTSFNRDNYRWPGNADDANVSITVQADAKTGKVKEADIKITSKLVTCEETNPNRNNPVKRVFRASELEEKGLQIRTYEPKLECLCYAHLTIEKGKRKVNIMPVTLNMVARFLATAGTDTNAWLIENLGIPPDEAPLVPRDRYLTRGNISPAVPGTIEGEEVLTVSYRDDSVDYYNPTEPRLDVAGQPAATAEYGTSARTSILLILALAVLLFGALRQAFIGWSIRRGAAQEVAEPGWGGKITLGVIALSGALFFSYFFSPPAALAIVGIICLLVVGAGTVLKVTAPNGG